MNQSFFRLLAVGIFTTLYWLGQYSEAGETLGASPGRGDTLEEIRQRWTERLPSLFADGTAISSVTIVAGQNHAGPGNFETRILETPTLTRLRDRANPHSRRRAIFFSAQYAAHAIDVFCSIPPDMPMEGVSNRIVREGDCSYLDRSRDANISRSAAGIVLGRPVFFTDGLVVATQRRSTRVR